MHIKPFVPPRVPQLLDNTDHSQLHSQRLNNWAQWKEKNFGLSFRKYFPTDPFLVSKLQALESLLENMGRTMVLNDV